MLASLIPLFNEDMSVRAYSLFAQKKNYLLNPSFLGTGRNDGASHVDGFEIIDSMGIETISEDKDVFVPVSNISIFSDISEQCNARHDRIVLLMDREVEPKPMYVDRLKELKVALRDYDN